VTMNDNIQVNFSAVDGISVVAEKIAQAFSKINKTSSLTAQQGLRQVNEAIGDKFNRSVRLSTERTNQFLTSLDKAPKSIQKLGASMVNVTNGNMRLATSFKELEKSPAQIQKALEGVLTQSERSRLGIYRFSMELKQLAQSGSVSVGALQTKFNQMMQQSNLSIERQRQLWRDFYFSIPDVARKATDQQVREAQRFDRERDRLQKKAMSDAEREQRAQAALLQRQTKEVERAAQQQQRAMEQAARAQARSGQTRFRGALNMGRIGIQSAVLGGQLATSMNSPSGIIGAGFNAAFMSYPLASAGPAGIAVAAGVAGLTAALVGLGVVLKSVSEHAHDAARNMLQMTAVASLRGLPPGVAAQQAKLGSSVSQAYGFKSKDVQGANLNLMESGLFGPDALNSAAIIAKIENQPIEQVGKDLADMIQSGQTESFTQKYRITSSRVVGMRKPNLAAAYPNSQALFKDIQQKLGPDVKGLVDNEPGDRMSASFERIQQILGGPVWGAFLKVLQPIADAMRQMAEDLDKMFQDQSFLDEMQKAFDEIGKALAETGPIWKDFAHTLLQVVVEGIKGFITVLPVMIRWSAALAAILNIVAKVFLILIELLKKYFEHLAPLAPVLKLIWENFLKVVAVINDFLDIIYGLLNGTKSLNDIFAALARLLKDIGVNGPAANAMIKHLGDLLRDAADKAKELFGWLEMLVNGNWVINIQIRWPELQLPTLPALELEIKLPPFGEMINAWWQQLIAAWEENTHAMGEVVETTMANVLLFLKEKGEAVTTSVGQAVANFGQIFVALRNSVEEVWHGLENTITGTLGNIRDSVVGFFRDVGDAIEKIPAIGKEIADRLRSSMPDFGNMGGPGTKQGQNGQASPSIPVIVGGAAGMPGGAGIHFGSGDFPPNPFGKKKDEDGRDINQVFPPITPAGGYDLGQIVGDASAGANQSSFTVVVNIQGGDFSDPGQVAAQAKRIGDLIGNNLRTRGGIQVP
jgi:hypothetical protein